MWNTFNTTFKDKKKKKATRERDLENTPAQRNPR
jgi:hypothetical protein